ncbi:MAG: HDOD domain-containing protein [Planctomycetota bacterium]
MTKDTRQSVEKLRDLPTLPEVAVHVMKLADDPQARLSELAAVIESDPALTAKLLRLANAAQLGMVRPVTTATRAVATMGLAAVKSAVLSIGVFQAFEQDSSPPDRKPLWIHSLAVACAAADLARATSRIDPELAFVAGLLHDIGKIGIAAVTKADYQSLADLARKRRVSVERVEKETFGIDHIECGRILARRWNLPQILEHVVRWHEPFTDATFLEPGERALIEIIQLAGALAAEQNLGFTDALPAGDAETLARELSFDPDVLDAARQNLSRSIEQRAAVLGLDVDQNEIYLDAVRRANVLLGTLYEELDRSRQALECKAAHFSGLHLTHQTIAPGMSPSEILALIVTNACEVFGLARVLLYYHEPGSDLVHAEACAKGASASDVSFRIDPTSPVSAERLAKDAIGQILEGQDGGNRRFTLIPMKLRGGASGGLACCGNGILDDPEFASLAELEALVDFAALSIDRSRLSTRLDDALESVLAAQRDKRRLEGEVRDGEKLAALGRMAAGAAHEMNNPLAIISGRAQVLRRKEHDPKRVRALETIIDQCERLSRIISDLLGYARPATPHFIPLEIRPTIARIASLLEPELTAAGIDFTSDIHPDVPVTLTADERQFEQVLANLLKNARQAIEDKGGTGRITVGLRLDESGEYLIVEVRDTGVGIHPDELPHIFEPFYSTKEAGRGTGLGLSIAASILSHHGGFIRAESELAVGTTLRSYWRLAGPPVDERPGDVQ